MAKVKIMGNAWRARCYALLVALLPVGAPADTLINEGFEGAFPGAWTVGDTNPLGTAAYWGDVNLNFGGEGTHSGLWKGYCAGTGFGGTTANPNYQNQMGARMTRTLNLARYGTASLTYWYKIPSIQTQNTDKLQVYLGNQLVGEHRTPIGAWTQGGVNLNGYAGSTSPIPLSFVFRSDAATVFEGAYLDDIVVTATPPAADAFEPDNTSAQAKPLARGVNQAHTIHVQGDADWLRFTVGALGIRNVWVTGQVPYVSGHGVGLEMWLYRGNGEQLDHDDGFYGMAGVRADALAAGTYFVRIQKTGNIGAVREYNVYGRWESIYVPDAYEADNTVATARAIANGTEQTHSIHVPGDRDWVNFVVPAAGARDVRLVFGPGIPDLFVWLYRGNGEQVAFAAGVDARTELAIAEDTLVAGTYYLKIQRSSDRSTLEAYTVRAEWTPNTVADAFEPDDTLAAARPIGNGETQNRTIHVAGNVDWARFVVPAAGARNVVVETAGDSGDTQMWVYRGSTGAQEGFDDDSGAGSFSRIALGNLPAGTHYIKVQENGNNGAIPAYTLRAAWTSP